MQEVETAMQGGQRPFYSWQIGLRQQEKPKLLKEEEEEKGLPGTLYRAVAKKEGEKEISNTAGGQNGVHSEAK